MYVPSTRMIISSYDVIFDESFSSELAYTSQPYSEAIAMRPEMRYTPCATSSRKQSDNIITFVQFEEGNILTITRKDAERDDESDDNSIQSQLRSEEEMGAMDSGDESDHDLIYTKIMEDTCDISQFHPSINRRAACYKIRDFISKRQS